MFLKVRLSLRDCCFQKDTKAMPQEDSGSQLGNPVRVRGHYKIMLEAPPSLKTCLKTVPTLKFNISSANLPKMTRVHGTKSLLSLYGSNRSLAELQEVNA